MFEHVSNKQRKLRKKYLLKIWVSIGLKKEYLYEIYREEYPLYKKNTWVMLYAWFMGEPIYSTHTDAFINELCSHRRGKILMQLAGGYYYNIRNGKSEGLEILPKSYNFIFYENFAIITFYRRLKIWLKRVCRWRKEKKKG